MLRQGLSFGNQTKLDMIAFDPNLINASNDESIAILFTILIYFGAI
jgi:hypothetical protein